MTRMPRLAIGTIQPGADLQAMLWALIEVFRRAGLQVQSFLSRSHFPKNPGVAAVTGTNVRHLDSWLMSPEICRDLFERGVNYADLALVEGQFAPAAGEGRCGGRLEPLCRWLDLPRLIVLDSSQIGPCNLPLRPRFGDALLLDRVAGSRRLACLTTELESLWGMPVVGSLPELTRLRRRLECVEPGDPLPPELCQSLGDQLAASSRLERIWELAVQRELPQRPGGCGCLVEIFPKLTVAIAYDEAFHCYFPDTLDLLELRGATVVAFSPLRDEAIPDGTDIVYLGCGHPELHARALSENHCISASIRNHVRSGGRVYAEGGGAAYLCQQMETPDGEQRRMVGILPAVAKLQRSPISPVPVEVTLAKASWLGRPGARLRGYTSTKWRLEPFGPPAGLLAGDQRQYDLIGNASVVGSLLHLNFAAQPQCLHHFFYPQRYTAAATDPWAVAR
ncbi:MAG: hypothetical protein HUU20_07935 [Pirellulales bacterium]|nr:hypothetical protein [Pirellulales bacterium]